MILVPGKYLLVGEKNTGKTSTIASIILENTKHKVHVLGDSILWRRLDWIPENVFVEFLRSAYTELDFLTGSFDSGDRIWLVECGTFGFLNFPKFFGEYRDLTIPIIREIISKYSKILYFSVESKEPVFYLPFEFINQIFPKFL